MYRQEDHGSAVSRKSEVRRAVQRVWDQTTRLQIRRAATKLRDNLKLVRCPALPRLGDARSSLGDAKSSLGDAESSLVDAESSLGDAESSLGDAESSLGDAESSLCDA